MRTHSYSVGSGTGSAAEIAATSDLSVGAELVLLGAQSANTAITEAASIRKLLPDSKIVLLLEAGFPIDLENLLASEVDACVPLFVSAGTLIRTLDLVAAAETRVLIVSDLIALPKSPVHDACQPAIETESNRRPADASEMTTIATATPADPQPVPPASASTPDVSRKATPRLAPLRIMPELSEREIQILNGLVKGHANKVIARTCDITEATVKVHIRSILRKIQVGNRTQAAIWALESGYSVDVTRPSH